MEEVSCKICGRTLKEELALSDPRKVEDAEEGWVCITCFLGNLSLPVTKSQ
jgi:hypothetical protein